MTKTITDFELLADLKRRVEELEKRVAPTIEVEPGKEWPQVGDTVYYITTDSYGIDLGVTSDAFRDNVTGRQLLSVGEFYRSEALARRYLEARKVQAELRAMPGRCAPPDDTPRQFKYCIDFNGTAFSVDRYFFFGCVLVAVGGVWFDTAEAAQHAIDTIGQDRLRIWLDDHLQTPIKEDS